MEEPIEVSEGLENANYARNKVCHQFQLTFRKCFLIQCSKKYNHRFFSWCIEKIDLNFLVFSILGE